MTRMIPRMISRSKGKEDESGQKASEQHRSLSDLSKTDFPRNFGKSVFDCNFFKAMSDLDMMNYDIDEVEIIKELEMIRNIPQTSRDGDDQVHNLGLYIWISHVYRLRDTNEKKEQVERTLLSDISTIFQRLRQSAAELSADNAGGNGVIASVSIDSPPSSERTIPSTTNLEPTSPTQDRMKTYPVLSDLLIPASTDTPRCKYCQQPTTKEHAERWNQNGNAGRPYFFCEPCQKIQSWADKQGIYAESPLCFCASPKSSRLDYSSREKGNKPYLSCATGQCKFFTKRVPTEVLAKANPIAEMAGMSLGVVKIFAQSGCDSTGSCERNVL